MEAFRKLATTVRGTPTGPTIVSGGDLTGASEVLHRPRRTSLRPLYHLLVSWSFQ
jgi:hypothetical protein